MPFCHACGGNALVGTKFCRHCGAPRTVLPEELEAPSTSTRRLRPLKYHATCVLCTKTIEAGTIAWWDSAAKQAACADCLTENASARMGSFAAYDFDEGASARRRAEALRGQSRLDEAELWDKGGTGETAVGRHLNELQGRGLVAALHDVRRPGTPANIDHIAVAPTGVYVIDAKHWKGTIAIVNRGTALRPDWQLRVGRWNQMRAVTKLQVQVDVVNAALQEIDLRLQTHPVLCFVHGDWDRAQGRSVGGVAILSPEVLVKQLQRPGPLEYKVIERAGRYLRTRLKSA